MNATEAQIAAVAEEVGASRRYRGVARDLITHLAAIEVAKGRKHKDTVKEVKNRLHQVVGAYLDGNEPDYAVMLAALSAAASTERLAVCRELMGRHASSRERLAILDEFYTTVLAGLGPIGSVVDVACGFNPLAAPWMPLAPGARYVAVDVLDDMAGFLDRALAHLGLAGQGISRDVTLPGAAAALGPFEVALVIKALPCLAQIDRAAPEALLTGLDARVIIVSYPVRSLGGDAKGMRGHYAEAFAQVADGHGWLVERFDFADELAFRVTKAAESSR